MGLPSPERHHVLDHLVHAFGLVVMLQVELPLDCLKGKSNRPEGGRLRQDSLVKFEVLVVALALIYCDALLQLRL